ncbi:hypothetical protein J113_22845 [Mycobacterium tuberculosis CAS/NITR204]|uniref:Uncharacterized protein n=1 Tax=Mycobacterium tuberculosis CAS/NITR204 TaxID=1310114 RepID=R4MCV1_MYCTX|nr:hypothetical protein J113_22845 [Mycobacterium tuberculosis CAS/NITR204]
MITATTTTVTTRGRAADLNRRPTDRPGDNAAYDGGDHTGDYRGPGGDRDPQRKWQRNKEDDK